MLLICGLMALHIPVARADEGVLLEYVPPDVTDAVIVETVKQALTGRKWTVSPGETGSLIAELSARSTDAKVEFFLEGRTVRYREIEVTRDFVSAGIGPANTGARTPVKAKTNIPERWLANLRQDLSRKLAANRVRTSAPIARCATGCEATPSIKARLETRRNCSMRN
jgi:hypothetical protein